MIKDKKNATHPAATVLIVDDHPAVREALTIRVSAQPDLKVCGEAADIAEALQLAAATDPDVAVIDIALQTGDGIDLIKRLKARNAKVRAIIWSMYSEDLYAERALRAGAAVACGFLHAPEAAISFGQPFQGCNLERVVEQDLAKLGRGLGRAPRGKI